jgi:Flp pilus assembly protein CpaB
MIIPQKPLLIIAASAAAASGLLVHHILSRTPYPAATNPQATSGALAAQVSSDLRAIALSLQDDGGAGALAEGGDRVDVILTRAAGKTTHVETVLHGARVLIPVKNKKNALGAKSVSLVVEVTTAEAETLARAKAEGKLSVTVFKPKEGPSRPEAAPGRASSVRVFKFGVLSPAPAQ